MRLSNGERRMRGCIAGILLLISACLPLTASARSFTGSAVVMRESNPTLVVDGRPFFFYGAAFFYERIPAAQWRASMLALRALGFNTLDLYVPWNWHEPGDGAFDFDGHTNARRNLRAVLALARELHFKLVVRPGPVIRNEWRNGGYPAWLLTRPEYGMPLHDVLEGRYPATATLQNANSDDAAAQWLRNPTHMTYASRWLRAALHEFDPYADLVLAVQLDDDQGAYIDNQTWPAPHFQAYLRALEAIVRSVVGARLPVFINTYEMKVTASAPVWAMGNWYQSDAYSIGEHDRAALEFSTGLLQTQTRFPVAISEFQAGWLAPPEDPAPRPADPTNTTLALYTLLGSGMRGAIAFPAQDTIDPAGWEAPFANAVYAWDAALGADLRHSARYEPTKRFGELVRADGPALAQTRRLTDGAIAYLTSAYDERRQTNADVFAIVARTMAAQYLCRARHLSCDLIDLRFASDAALRRYPFVVLPRVDARPFAAAAEARLERYRAAGGRVLSAPPDVVTPVAGGIPDATLLIGSHGAAFLDVVNFDLRPRTIPRTVLRLPGGAQWTVGPLTVSARDAALLRRGRSRTIAVPARATSAPAPTTGWPRCPAPTPTDARFAFGSARTIEDDCAADGFPRLTLTNDRIAVTVAPAAGARALAFSTILDDGSIKNVFTSVGGLRDDVALQPPLSTSDRIGKYTRSFPAGTFNRSYAIVRRTARPRAVSATLTYAAPDVVPDGAEFERTLTVEAGEPGFTVTARTTFGGDANASAQRAVRYDSFDTRGALTIDDRAAGAVGFFYPEARCVAIVAWPPAAVEDAQLIAERTSTVLRLRFAPGEHRTRYLLQRTADIAAARSDLLKERAAVSAKR
jgi:hypothetical protein